MAVYIVHDPSGDMISGRAPYVGSELKFGGHHRSPLVPSSAASELIDVSPDQVPDVLKELQLAFVEERQQNLLPPPLPRLQMMNAMDLAVDRLQRSGPSRPRDTRLTRLVAAVESQRRPPTIAPQLPTTSESLTERPAVQHQLLLTTLASLTQSKTTSAFSTQPSMTTVASNKSLPHSALAGQASGVSPLLTGLLPMWPSVSAINALAPPTTGPS